MYEIKVKAGGIIMIQNRPAKVKEDTVLQFTHSDWNHVKSNYTPWDAQLSWTLDYFEKDSQYKQTQDLWSWSKWSTDEQQQFHDYRTAKHK
jgi:hypothetical protein